MTRTQKKQVKFSKNHYGKWVALSKDKRQILGYSSNLKTLTKKVDNKNAVYTKALDPNKSYAF